jgi:hypothetical protein
MHIDTLLCLVRRVMAQPLLDQLALYYSLAMQ